MPPNTVSVTFNDALLHNFKCRAKMKLAPCPNCKTDDNLAVYKYDSGWQHVECDKCFYLGPGEGTKAQAMTSHNQQFIFAHEL